MSARPSFFSPKALLLTAALAVGYYLLISVRVDNVNPYYPWYHGRIDVYYSKMDSLAKITTWSERMFGRHMTNYEIPRFILRKLRPGDTVLLPPIEYGDQYTRTRSFWTDPRIFTYMTTLSPIVAYDDTARWRSVNTYVKLEPRSISVVRRGGSTNIDSLLTEYEVARQVAQKPKADDE